jgi:hypothetical protein
VILKWISSNFFLSSSVTGAIKSLTPGIKIFPSGETNFDTKLISYFPTNSVEQLTNEDQIGHGLVDGSTESTRVEIPIRSRDLDLVVVDTSETVSQVGSLGVEPVVV